jgi:hypothetical protein
VKLLLTLLLLLPTFAIGATNTITSWVAVNTNDVIQSHTNLSLRGTASVHAITFADGSTQTTAVVGAVDVAAVGAAATNAQTMGSNLLGRVSALDGATGQVLSAWATASNAYARATNSIPSGGLLSDPVYGETALWQGSGAEEIEYRFVDCSVAWSVMDTNDPAQIGNGLQLSPRQIDLYSKRLVVHNMAVSPPSPYVEIEPQTNGLAVNVGPGAASTWMFGSSNILLNGSVYSLGSTYVTIGALQSTLTNYAQRVAAPTGSAAVGASGQFASGWMNGTNYLFWYDATSNRWQRRAAEAGTW